MPSSRSKAIALAAVLILVSGAFIATAAASTTSALAPFRRGDAYGLERPLSRFGVALGVIVGRAVDGEPSLVQGATVTVSRTGVDATREKQTDEKGHAIFQLPRGPYHVKVAVGNWSASQDIVLAQGERLAVFFDEAGTAHWRHFQHGDLERLGETHTLLVRVGQRNGSGLSPIAGAQVRVERVLVDGERAPVEAHEMRTGPRGAAVFELHKGVFDVEVSWQGQTATARVVVREDSRVFFVDDESGLHPARTERATTRALR